MDHKMILEILSPPIRRSITTVRTLLRITIVSVGCTLFGISFLFAAELFPFAPPPSQQLTQCDFDSAVKHCGIRAGESPDRVANFSSRSVRSDDQGRATRQLLVGI